MNILSSKNKTILLLVALAPILMSEYCGLPDYGTAHTANEITYLAKEPYIDSCTNAFYISGRFSHTVSPTYQNERTYFGELTLHRSHTWKYANLSYGIFGYGGSYKVYEIEKYRGNKYFGGIGGTAELNFNLPFKKVNWRVVGVRITWLYENGRYTSFREIAEKDSLIENINPSKTQFHITGFTEVVIRLKKVDLGFYLSPMGVTLGNGESNLTISGAIYVTHMRMTYFVQATTAERIGTSLSAGISYRIPQKRALAPIRFCSGPRPKHSE